MKHEHGVGAGQHRSERPGVGVHQVNPIVN